MSKNIIGPLIIGILVILFAIFYTPSTSEQTAVINTKSMVTKTVNIWEDLSVINDTIKLKQYALNHADQILFLPESVRVELVKEHDQYNLTKIRIFVQDGVSTEGWILSERLSTKQVE